MSIEKEYFKIPNNIFDQNLNPNELSIIFLLYRYQNNNEYSYPSYDHIAKKCGMSKSTAIRTMNKLVEKEFVLKQTRISDYKDNDSNLYVVSERHHPSVTDTPNKEQKKKNNLNIHQTKFNAYIEKYCLERFGMKLRASYKFVELNIIDGLELSELKDLLDEHIQNYDQCNYDYIEKIQHRIM